jgi:capsid protein
VRMVRGGELPHGRPPFVRKPRARAHGAGVRSWRGLRPYPLRPFGPFGLPFALELIEAERLADDISIGTMAIAARESFPAGHRVRRVLRPVAYYFRKRHRGELRFSDNSTNTIERVPADQIIPLAVIDRWPQSRGEPWMHTAATR